MKTEIFNGKLLYLPFLTCEVKCEVKITFRVNSCGTNEPETYRKRVVQKGIFMQGTLTLNRPKLERCTQSPALTQRWAPNKRAGCPAGLPIVFLSRPRPNVGRFTHKHKHKHKHNISISKWEHPRRNKHKHKHKHKQKNEPNYLSYAVLTLRISISISA